MVSLLPSKIKDFCHLPRQREAKFKLPKPLDYAK